MTRGNNTAQQAVRDPSEQKEVIKSYFNPPHPITRSFKQLKCTQCKTVSPIFSLHFGFHAVEKKHTQQTATNKQKPVNHTLARLDFSEYTRGAQLFTS